MKSMETKELKSKRRIILPILLAICFLLAVAGWGFAYNLSRTHTPRLNPGANELLMNNPLMSPENSELLNLIERRHSTPRGEFTGAEISDDALQLLGWAATGKNRDGSGFVVPLAMGAEPYVTVYLAQSDGVSRFSWESNDFERVIDDDIRTEIQSSTTGVGEAASAIWIYVIETDSIPQNNIYWAWQAIGAMSQQQYLLADALDVQTRFIGNFNDSAVVELLGLNSSTSVPAALMIMAGR